VTLICDVIAYPAVSFKWKFKAGDVTSGGRINITDEDFRSYLHIHDVEEADRGDYQCTADNVIGSEMFTVYLLKPGKIIVCLAFDLFVCFLNNHAHS